MKVLALLVTAILLLSASLRIENRQIRYLPVFISFSDTTSHHAEIALTIKAVFAAQKIKVISKSDAEAYIKNEAQATMEGFLRSGGDIKNFDKFKQYQATNTRSVANSLMLKIDISRDGIINDTIRWVNHTIPIILSNPPKNKWHMMILDSNHTKTMLEMSQGIVDSIIASGVLVKE
ncbi:MAG: hypothetical protein JNK91_09085 [Ferruginibacter sp.]|nr:hypothetical protein [Ferruginibacter sp.]